MDSIKWVFIAVGAILLTTGWFIQLSHSSYLKAVRGNFLKKFLSGQWVYPYIFYEGNPVWLILSLLLEILGAVIILVSIAYV